MLKTISEKDKLTFVYQERTLPLLLVLGGIAALIIGVLLMEPVTPQKIIFLSMFPIVAALVAYYLMTRKQILVIDSAKQMLEEYRGSVRSAFKFAEIEYADVERVREEEDVLNEDTSLDGEPIATPVKKLHLNFHPYLDLKDPHGKHFLLDNHERGIDNYRVAKTIVEAINQALALSKETTKTLNVYQIKTSQKTNGLLVLFILVFLGALGFAVARYLGYV